MNLPESKLIKDQKIVKTKVIGNEKCVVTIRHDDNCGNGHNSFSICGELYEKSRIGVWEYSSGGQITEDIERFFPELRPYMKWHLTSTDGPMHYLANSMYHAGDKDYNGLRKGEVRQIRNGRSGLPSWKLTVVSEDGQELNRLDLKEYIDAEECPTVAYRYEYHPWNRIGEGKEPDLEAACRCAVWPEAELEDFTEEKLQARLPVLMEEFKAAVESLGMVY